MNAYPLTAAYYACEQCGLPLFDGTDYVATLVANSDGWFCSDACYRRALLTETRASARTAAREFLNALGWIALAVLVVAVLYTVVAL